MLLSINDAKVAELLRSTDRLYAVAITPEMPIGSENYSRPAYPVTNEASGTVYAAPLLVTPETKERLMSIRRQIEGSDIPLKGAEQLTREIDEMRGRR
jgi:hypothetical protein